MNFLIIGAIAAAALFAVKKGSQINDFKNTFDYTWSVKNFRFHTWREIRFEIDLSILNPTDFTITITNPYIQILYNGTQLTRSTYNIPQFSIKPNGTTRIPRIEFRIDIFSNAFTIKDMLNKLLKDVSLVNLDKAKTILENNEREFLKLLTVRFTGRNNGIFFTKEFNLA